MSDFLLQVCKHNSRRRMFLPLQAVAKDPLELKMAIIMRETSQSFLP